MRQSDWPMANRSERLSDARHVTMASHAPASESCREQGTPQLAVRKTPCAISDTSDECVDMTEPPSAEPSQSDALSEGSQSNAPPSPAPKATDNVVQQDFANPTLSVIDSLSRKPSTSGLSHASATVSREGTPPPLPPRPNLGLLESRPSTSHSVRMGRPNLVSKATTQLSFADSANHQNESRAPSPSRASKARSYFGLNLGSKQTSDADDSASVRSVLPAADVGLDAESMLGEGMGEHEKPLLASLGYNTQDAESMFAPDPAFEQAFEAEFDEIEDMAQDGSNEGQRLSMYLDFGACADSICRIHHESMARKAEAFLDLVQCGKAHLQSAWRRPADYQLHRRGTDHHLVLPIHRRYIARLYCW